MLRSSREDAYTAHDSIREGGTGLTGSAVPAMSLSDHGRNKGQ